MIELATGHCYEPHNIYVDKREARNRILRRAREEAINGARMMVACYIMRFMDVKCEVGSTKPIRATRVQGCAEKSDCFAPITNLQPGLALVGQNFSRNLAPTFCLTLYNLSIPSM